MKQVYNREIRPEVPANVPKRIFAAAVIALPATVFFIVAVSFLVQGQPVDFLLAMLFFSALALVDFLLIFFALRTRNSHLNTVTRPHNTVIPQSTETPFYSVQCAQCGAMFDYQCSDLAFRPWFIKGYVECPCCHAPIRHSKEKNSYIPLRVTLPESDDNNE